MRCMYAYPCACGVYPWLNNDCYQLATEIQFWLEDFLFPLATLSSEQDVIDWTRGFIKVWNSRAFKFGTRAKFMKSLKIF